VAHHVVECGPASTSRGGGIGLEEVGLGGLDKARGKFVPDEIVELAGGLAEVELVER